MADLSPAAQALVDAIKSQAKVIDGVPYMPTGFEGKSASDLLDAVNSSYTKIGKATVAQNANAAGLDGGATHSNAVIPTLITAPPSSAVSILPNYSKEEIEAVAKQAVDECEIRSAVPNILNSIQLSEAIDAKCDIKPPAPFLPPEFLPDTPFTPAPQTEPEDALAPPKYTLVTLVNLDGLTENGNTYANVEVFKNDGDKVSCGETIMKVGGQAVTCPVVDGVIKKIITRDKAVKYSQLFVVEEPNPVDATKKVFAEADNLKRKIDEMILLKERLGMLEPKVWALKAIWAIYEGQYQGYIQYFETFNDLVKQLEVYTEEFNTNIAKLNSLLYTDKVKKGDVTITNPMILLSSATLELRTKVSTLLSRQKVLSDKAQEISQKLQAVKDEQPTYFSTTNSVAANGSITSVPYKGGVEGTQYVIIPLGTGEKLSSPYVDLLKKLPTYIQPFTNNILLNNKYFTSWDELVNPIIPNVYYDINKPDSFTYANLIRYETSATDYFFMSNNIPSKWEGSMYNVRKDFFDNANAISAGIKPTDDPDNVIEQTKNLSDKERALPYDIENLANDTFDKIVSFSKNFGYNVLNEGSAFIQTGVNKTKVLDKVRNTAKDNFDVLHNEYVSVRDKIAEIEKYIDVFPKTIKDITTSGCVMVGGGPSSVGQYEGKKTKIIPWPLNESSLSSAPADNDKENGNPDPNSPPSTSLTYWKKYCKRATTVNLLPTYWPIGIIIPTPSGLIKIPFPIIWTPLAVVPSDLALIVIGITMCGICPGPFIYVVNPGWPFPIGMVGPKQSWFVTGNRGPKQLDGDTTSEVSAGDTPTVNVPLKYTKNGQTIKKSITINIGPIVTQLLPFIQDDLPVYERLTMTNVAYLMYLAKWCNQGKNTYGFFTS